jgi:hypothetical protein
VLQLSNVSNQDRGLIGSATASANRVLDSFNLSSPSSAFRFSIAFSTATYRQSYESDITSHGMLAREYGLGNNYMAARRNISTVMPC